MSPELVILAARLGFVALATFLAIVVWARTRDAAWMLVVVGIVAGYADILYTLRLAGGAKVLSLVPSHHNHAIGERIGIRLDVDHVVTFPVEDGVPTPVAHAESIAA